MQAPEVRYVRREGISVAYQVFASASIDLLCIPRWCSHLEAQWRYPPTAHLYTRLGRFARCLRLRCPRGRTLLGNDPAKP